MLGIELSTGQKVQLAFIVVILSTAAYFIVNARKPVVDTAVNCHVFTRHFGIDPTKAYSAANGKNPVDPKKDELVSQFEFHDGKMEIIQYPNIESPKAPRIAFAPETRNPNIVYQYYQDPMAPVALIKDEFRHALAYLTYISIYKPPSLGLLGQLGMNDEQKAQEQKYRDIMLNINKNTNAEVDGGTFHRELLDKVLAALRAYNAKAGDPQKDTAKAELAHKVLESSAAYIARQYQEKNAAIDKYLDAMEKLLNQEQKQKLIDLVKQRTNPGRGPINPPPARRGPGSQPTPGRAGPPPTAPPPGRAATAPGAARRG